MAKPILVIDISWEQVKNAQRIEKVLKKVTGNEYHVIVRCIDNGLNTIQCFNDCKGLTDIDIKMLINEIKQK